MAEVSNSTLQTVLSTVKSIAEIDKLDPNEDFYDAGLTSLASLTLLLELEDSFNVQIADERFIACRTANDVTRLIEGLQA